MDEAYERGFATADLLSNPYPDGSVEARRFVDGWVAGRKWEQRLISESSTNSSEPK